MTEITVQDRAKLRLQLQILLLQGIVITEVVSDKKKTPQNIDMAWRNVTGVIIEGMSKYLEGKYTVCHI